MQIDDIVRYFPQLHIDTNEPLRPSHIGYQIYEADHYLSIYPSPTYKRLLYFLTEITEAEVDANYIIEYSLWYDADIQHLYELEHLWVYLDEHKKIIKIEGSRHGMIKDLKVDHAIFVEPGKHGHFQGELTERAKKIFTDICRNPGTGGLLGDIDAPEFREFGTGLAKMYKTTEKDGKIREYMARYAFEPSFDFRPYTPPNELFVEWNVLKELIKKELEGLLHKICDEPQTGELTF
jgi:hypothetical protein